MCCWWEPQERKCLTHAHTDVSARWADYYAAVYQVPVELVAAIIDEESGWNPYAVSNKGAAGIMQLMPATAVRFGVRNRFLVEENIRGGVAYLAWLKQKFNGDLRLITAAYYVGEYQLDGVRSPQSLYGFLNSQLGDEQAAKLKIKQETPVRVLDGQLQTARIAPGQEAIGVVALEMASSTQPTVLRFQFPSSKQSEDGLSNGPQTQIAAFLVR